jgi:hypothetical protein
LSQVGDAVCASLAALPCLAHIDLRGQSGVTLAGLQTLSSLAGLRSLALEDCPAICDRGLPLIAAHTGLTSLWLKLPARMSAPLHAGASCPAWLALGMSTAQGVCMSWP